MDGAGMGGIRREPTGREAGSGRFSQGFTLGYFRPSLREGSGRDPFALRIFRGYFRPSLWEELRLLIVWETKGICRWQLELLMRLLVLDSPVCTGAGCK
jgi:hypothetical protein